MKMIISFLLMTIISACAGGKEKNYTGSTPAGTVVRTFLGIPLSDSLDFIRWNLAITEDRYTLHCNYGIGKPNTNGFINGGKKIDLRGEIKKEKNIYLLQNGSQTLKLSELNVNLLHVLNNDNTLLIGNGGWGYTLNNMAPVTNEQINLVPKQTILKDSMAFQGRTPCGVPGIIPPGKECYKQKWYIVLYADAGKNLPTRYKLLTATWRQDGGKKGNWKIVTGKDERIVYQLNDEKEDPFIYLLKLDEGVVIFTDLNGNLLVGDLDFSYTLSKDF